MLMLIGVQFLALQALFLAADCDVCDVGDSSRPVVCRLSSCSKVCASSFIKFKWPYGFETEETIISKCECLPSCRIPELHNRTCLSYDQLQESAGREVVIDWLQKSDVIGIDDYRTVKIFHALNMTESSFCCEQHVDASSFRNVHSSSVVVFMLACITHYICVSY
uniref:Uncharacterized protein n=1 Tax=Plectus sambesii TaxID=2011161 RepID=A0A914VHG2_9BILA